MRELSLSGFTAFKPHTALPDHLAMLARLRSPQPRPAPPMSQFPPSFSPTFSRKPCPLSASSLFSLNIRPSERPPLHSGLPFYSLSSGAAERLKLDHRTWKIPWTEKPGGLQSMGSQELDPIEQLNHHHSKPRDQTHVSCIAGTPRGNPACRGTSGGRRKAVRDRLALQGGTGDFP